MITLYDDGISASFVTETRLIIIRYMVLKMKNELRHKIHFLEKKLRKLINSWELIPGCPSDEFDSLNQRILSVLMNNNDKQKIKGIIQTYIAVDLGMFTNKDEIESKYNAVMNWWENEN